MIFFIKNGRRMTMWLQNSKNSIENQETASAGALPTHYIEPWGPSWLERLKEAPDRTFSLGWKHDVPGAQFSHRVTATGENQYAPDIVLRIFCHLVMNCIPARGLPELCETMKELYEFYRNEPSAPADHALPGQGMPVRV